MKDSQLKYLELILLGNSILYNSNWDRLIESIMKHPYLELSETLFKR